MIILIRCHFQKMMTPAMNQQPPQQAMYPVPQYVEQVRLLPLRHVNSLPLSSLPWFCHLFSPGYRKHGNSATTCSHGGWIIVSISCNGSISLTPGLTCTHLLTWSIIVGVLLSWINLSYTRSNLYSVTPNLNFCTQVLFQAGGFSQHQPYCTAQVIWNSYDNADCFWNSHDNVDCLKYSW